MSDLRVYEWVNPSEFTPENGWVQDLIESGRLREIVLRQKLFQDVDTVGEVFTFAYEVVEEA